MTKNYPLYVSSIFSEPSNKLYKKLDEEVTNYRNNPQKKNVNKKEKQ